MALTDKQREAVENRAGNLLVSASAGSGKTTAMVSRIISLLKEGAFIGDMLIITFTKAAAADMRCKISEKLVEMRENDESFERQLRALPGAKIGTIDSWCSFLVQNYFYAADADADYELIGGKENRALCDAVTDKLIDEFTEKNPDFAPFYECFINNRSDSEFKKFIYGIVEYASARVDPYEWFSTCCDKYDSKEAENSVREDVKRRSSEALGLLENIRISASAAGYDKLVEHCADVESDFCGGRNFKRSPGDKNPDFIELNEAVKAVKARLKTIKDDKKNIDNFESTAEVKKQAEIAAKFAEAAFRGLAEEKKKLGTADYGDLERIALRILNSQGVGDEIRASYKYVFVDEYQDVNPLQDALIERAAGGKLFIVGDVKQSIYAFRMSEPDIFLEKFYKPENHGIAGVIQFNENFRSGNAVVDFCNDVFSRCMTPSFGGIDYDKARLVFAKSDGAGEAALRLLKPLEKVEKKKKNEVYDVCKPDCEDARREIAMAEFIVSDISARLSSPDEKGEKVREKDVAVLFRSGSGVVKNVYDMLKKGGVNVFLRQKIYFSAAWEIRALDNFLKLLVVGTDETALAGYLLSPLCSIGEEQLYAAVSNGVGSFAERVALCSRCGNDETALKIGAALERLDRYGEIARDATVAEILGGVIAETEYAEKILASECGAAGVETIDKYLEYLSTLKCASTVVDYVRYLENGDVQFESSAPEGALKIMTVHMSKGLQFPYVYLVDCDKRFNLSDANGRCICDRDLGLCIKTGAIGETRSNFMSEAAKMRLKKRQKEEELRLLYVAMTRAEKGLYCYAFDGSDEVKEPCDADCFLDWLRPSAAGVTEIRSVVDKSDEKFKETAPVRKKVDRTELAEKIARNVAYVYPYESHEIKTTVTGLAGEQTVSAVTPAGDAEALAEKGTRLHAAMEKIDFQKPFDEEKTRLGDMMANQSEESLLRTAHAQVGAIVARFGGKVYKEQSFVARASDGGLVQGIIDLLAVNGDKALIIDYKLTSVKNIDSEKYKKQINLYAAAAENVLGVRVTEMYLYSFSSGMAKKVEKIPSLL